MKEFTEKHHAYLVGRFYEKLMEVCPDKAEGCANSGEVTAWSPDHIEKVYMCPWAAQFKEMGIPKCGTLYCQYVDKSIATGFNPELVYEVPQSMHERGCCLHISRDANFEENQEFHKHTEYHKTFDYHCGHCFSTFRGIAAAILGTSGETIAMDVLAQFGTDYGKEMADVLLTYKNVDFNLI